ncbi:MAG: N-acetylmuramoyl-L-alanine amidase, partial [Moorella sp. (in: Bacteria)]|nr:N-acetylmuramoyl-L-alanine amidase [Moorella sp. (in: firmicutes)]
DKKVVLDPGHGGSDGGWRGPVNLWERDMAWKTALELGRFLTEFKARVFWTRQEDENPSWQDRLGKATRDIFCFISVHQFGSPDAGQRGTAVLYNPAAPGNEELAARVLERIVARVKTPARGIKADEELARLGKVPGLRIEPVAITNWVDEGLLRNPYFHQKVALATAVAIKQYFRQEQ